MPCMKSMHPRSSQTGRVVALRVLGCLLLLLVAFLLLPGCERGANPPGGPSISGTYVLVTVDGNKLPYTVAHEGGAPKVLSGTFTIANDGTCKSKIEFVLPSGAASTREVSGTFTREGPTLQMRWTGAGTTVGTLKGDNFSMNNEGIVFAYRK
jgi:hypothetical protein